MHTFDAPVTEIWSLIPTLDLESDKSQCLNHRDELDRTVQLPSRVVDGMLYIAQGSYNYMGLRKPSSHTCQRKQHAVYNNIFTGYMQISSIVPLRSCTNMHFMVSVIH